MTSSYSDILARIEAALEAARAVFTRFTPGAIETEYKIGHDPVTEADRAVDAVLRQNLLRDGEGWLSEESVDDLSRLDKSRVWVVDPLDGTREFVSGHSGILRLHRLRRKWKSGRGRNLQSRDQRNYSSARSIRGVLYNGKPARPSQRTTLTGSLILASRSEVKRGEWQPFQSGDYQDSPDGLGRL